MRTTNSLKFAVLGLGLCMAAALVPNRSEAAVIVNAGFAAPAGLYGHYETRLQRVLVVPEHRERRWVEPVYQTTCDACGEGGRVLVKAGFWEQFCVPARYEDRSVSIWVAEPVCYETYGRTYYGGNYGGFSFGYGHGFGGNFGHHGGPFLRR